jgi:hypothetical protein
MPTLPLDHPEPFAATLGVMVYPGTDEGSMAKARAFASQWLAEPLRRAREAGYSVPYETLALIAEGSGQPLGDVQARFTEGLLVGDLYKAYFVLAQSRPELASLNNAFKLVGRPASLRRIKGSARTALKTSRNRFLAVAHLWAAWCLRDGKFEVHPEIGYDGYADFQMFLAEAEILRHWGQNWQPDRDKSEPPLPTEVWRVPDGWEPIHRQPGWPPTGGFFRMSLPDELLKELRPRGRPRRVS